jgi:hypothetical protein
VNVSSALNQAHRGLSRHVVRNLAVAGDDSSWNSLCLDATLNLHRSTDDEAANHTSAADPFHPRRTRSRRGEPAQWIAEIGHEETYLPERMPDLLLVEYAGANTLERAT